MKDLVDSFSNPGLKERIQDRVEDAQARLSADPNLPSAERHEEVVQRVHSTIQRLEQKHRQSTGPYPLPV